MSRIWSRTHSRDADAARLCQCLQPRGDVDAVAVDVVAIDDDVAQVDPNPGDDAVVLTDFDIAVDHPPRDLGGAADRIDHARELHQHAVAGRFDDAAAVLPDLWIDELAAMRLEALQRPFLVRAHQPRVACHIGGEDRGETAFDRLFHHLPEPRRS